jgi:hypothetical protein
MQTTRTSNSQQSPSTGGKLRHGRINWLGDAGLLLAFVGYITLAYYTFAVVGATEPAAGNFVDPPQIQLAVDEAPRSTPEKINVQQRAPTAP